MPYYLVEKDRADGEPKRSTGTRPTRSTGTGTTAVGLCLRW